MPDKSSAGNRMHLDLRGTGDDPAALVDKLVTRGAKVLYEASQGPHHWTTNATRFHDRRG